VFRHSLATSVLRNGALSGKIGEILRHRRADSTAIYAKGLAIAPLAGHALARRSPMKPLPEAIEDYFSFGRASG
jgi:integrase